MADDREPDPDRGTVPPPDAIRPGSDPSPDPGTAADQHGDDGPGSGRDASPATVLSALILLIAIFTNIVSNNAAAVIGTQIGIGIAEQLGVAPEPFVLAVLFGANLSYATPMSYKTNLLVMSAGNYTFNDFLKVGLPLTCIMWLTYSWILSSMYL